MTARASAGQDPAALPQGGQGRVAELDGIDAHDRVSAVVPEPRSDEVGHAEPGLAARPAAGGDGDRYSGEIQAHQAGAGPAGDLMAVAASPTSQVDEDLPRCHPQGGDHLGEASPGEQAIGDDLRRKAERALENPGPRRGIRGVRVPRVEGRGIRHGVSISE